MQFLVIEGNIGAGKTTLAKMLNEEIKAKLLLEKFENNPFLSKFYDSPERFSLPLELSFLADRYNQMKKEAFDQKLFHTMIISDFHFSKTSIFAQNTLKKDEYRLFRQIYDILSESIRKPDLYIYLHKNAEELQKNISLRGRDYEKNINRGYLEKIAQGYFNFFKKVDDFPILIIETNNIDFVKNPSQFNQIKDAIFNTEYKLGVNRFLL